MWPQVLKQPHRSFAAPALIYSQVHPGHIGGAGRDVNVMGHGGSQKAKQGGAGEAVNFEVFLVLGGYRKCRLLCPCIASCPVFVMCCLPSDRAKSTHAV